MKFCFHLFYSVYPDKNAINLNGYIGRQQHKALYKSTYAEMPACSQLISIIN
ncbi:hypothetical protein ECoL_04706 [Escherichia coli EC4100B]|nr:hypothetical protein ECoL_04706 [Escherichia coli EC4100B]